MHKYATALQLILNDDQLEVCKLNNVWTFITHSDALKAIAIDCGYKFRKLEKVRYISGRKCPFAETKTPAFGTEYWMPVMAYSAKVTSNCWEDSDFDKEMLDRGLIFLKREHAVEVADAWIILMSDTKDIDFA